MILLYNIPCSLMTSTGERGRAENPPLEPLAFVLTQTFSGASDANFPPFSLPSTDDLSSVLHGQFMFIYTGPLISFMLSEEQAAGRNVLSTSNHMGVEFGNYGG